MGPTGRDRRKTDGVARHGLPPAARRVHFVGAGGIGMSGIAEMMSGLGYDVSGSDLTASAVTARLCELGIEVEIGHDARWVSGADAVVVSAAVSDDNPEVVEARRRDLPVVRRGAMLAGLARSRSTVAVTGSHGKSTTSSMVAVVLAECGLDPSAVIGARVAAFGSNTRVGRGPHFVVEADESEPSLLELTPQIAVLTNLEDEHLDHYGTFERLQDTVVGFANRVTETGAVVLCTEDPELLRLRERILRRVVTYGLDDTTADVVGAAPELDATGSRCRVHYTHDQRSGVVPLVLGVPGRHNLLNAIGAFAVALEIGLEPVRIAAALGQFAGVDRRFQVRGDVAGVRVIDDYGHHPTEIAAVLSTARRQAHVRLVAVFQAHRYTRTARFLEAFGRVLASADVVVLTDIFPAGETPIPGVSAERLADAVRGQTNGPVHLVQTLDQVVSLVTDLARPGDLVLTLGAGSIGDVGDRLLDAIARKTGGVGHP
ncbi:MAG: UDP-N-acetylmuramate--L-alanine ligase [Vicinamibacterales bacterium]|nr:UDP-N-acetylmuramate--L-alanine ligase [Vicinamibacterales bacterium]